MRVLLVEPHAPSQRAIIAQLQALDCAPTTSQDQRGALPLISQAVQEGSPFRLALVSSAIPMADWSALSESGIPLVKLTRLGQIDNPERLADEGFAEQLCKPFRLAELKDCLKRVGLGMARDQTRTVALGTSTPRAASKSLRILLADDDHTNQLVASKLLERLGYRAQTVANGHEALQALQATEFDLILMDCQMPEMDGFEATRRIRKGEAGARNSQLPIVALTANAMLADRQECLVAGMNGHISKPIDLAHLEAALKQWEPKPTPRSESAHSDGRHHDPAVPSPDPIRSLMSAAQPAGGGSRKPILDQKTLHERTINDHALAQRVTAGILSDLPGQIKAVKRSLENEKHQVTAGLARRLAGAAKLIGAEALCDAATEMEHAARENDASRLSPLLSNIEIEFDLLLQTASSSGRSASLRGSEHAA